MIKNAMITVLIMTPHRQQNMPLSPMTMARTLLLVVQSQGRSRDTALTKIRNRIRMTTMATIPPIQPHRHYHPHYHHQHRQRPTAPFVAQTSTMARRRTPRPRNSSSHTLHSWTLPPMVKTSSSTDSMNYITFPKSNTSYHTNSSPHGNRSLCIWMRIAPLLRPPSRSTRSDPIVGASS